MPLKSVTVTPWNVSELVRLCLRKHDVDDAASLSTKSRDSEEDDDLDEEDEVVSLFCFSFSCHTKASAQVFCQGCVNVFVCFVEGANSPA